MNEYFRTDRENLFYPNARQAIRIKTLPREGEMPPRIVIELYANKPRIISDNESMISFRASMPHIIDEIIRSLAMGFCHN